MWIKILSKRIVTLILVVLLIFITAMTYVIRSEQASARAESNTSVMYLIPEDSSSIEDSLTPERLVNEATHPLGVTSRWQTISELASKQALQVLIIHRAAIPVVDQAELQTFFRRQGLVVVGIGIPGDELSQLVGMPQLYTSNWSDDGFTGYETSQFFYIYSYWVEGEQTDIERVESAESLDIEVENPLSRGMRSSTESLLIEDGLYIMWHLIDSHLETDIEGISGRPFQPSHNVKINIPS